MIINICQHLVNIGNPNPCLRVAVGRGRFLFLFLFQICLFENVCVCFPFLLIFVNIWSAFYNMCQQLLIYGTAYLPTVRSTVRSKRIHPSSKRQREEPVQYNRCMGPCLIPYLVNYVVLYFRYLILHIKWVISQVKQCQFFGCRHQLLLLLNSFGFCLIFLGSVQSVGFLYYLVGLSILFWGFVQSVSACALYSLLRLCLLAFLFFFFPIRIPTKSAGFIN